jgi:hypothetical protein
MFLSRKDLSELFREVAVADYKLVLLTENVPGKEDEFNEWYTHVHMMDMASVPGIVGAQRFKLESTVMGEFKNRYLAIYDLETDDPGMIVEEVRARTISEGWVRSDAIDGPRNHVGIFKAITERVPHTPKRAKP